MDSFVKEMAVLLGVEAPIDATDPEQALRVCIKQEVSKLYMEKRHMQRQLEQLERMTLLGNR